MRAPRSSACAARLRDDIADDRVHRQPFGVSTRRPWRDKVRMALISRSIFWVEARMKPIDSGISSLAASRATSSTSPGCSLSSRGDQRGHRLVGGFELGGEAHDVDQRRAQIVADDVGELLDFLVGALQVGGALGDRAFRLVLST